jgi:hypothetical protein
MILYIDLCVDLKATEKDACWFFGGLVLTMALPVYRITSAARTASTSTAT